MTADPAELPSRLPWTLRILDRVPLSPVWIGAMLAALFCVIPLVYLLATGGDRELQVLAPGAFPQGLPSLWWDLLCGMMLGYLWVAAFYTLRGAAQDLRALRPALRLAASEFEHAARRVTSFDDWRVAAFCLLVVLVQAAVLASSVFYGPASLWPGGRPGLTDIGLIWVTVRNCLIAWLGAHLFYIDIALARRFSKLGETWAHVDLLDLGPLAPFARKGLRSVGIWMVLTVLVSLGFLAPWTKDIPVGSVLVFVGVALAALLLPVVGVHRRVQETKRGELDRVRALIRSRAAGSATVARTGALSDAPLSDLIAYEGRIASVSTWPFDVSTLLRFGLYVAIGLGSWVGGAVVERLVGTLLD